MSKSDLGFGMRSWRYSMLVKDGVIDKMFIELDVAGDPFEVSDANTMLNYINPNARRPQAIITKPGCPFCAKAKAMLTDNDLAYGEIVLGHDATIRAVRALTGKETVPQDRCRVDRDAGYPWLRGHAGRRAAYRHRQPSVL